MRERTRSLGRIPGPPIDLVAEDRVGEASNMGEDIGEVGREPIIETLLTNPIRPATLRELGVAREPSRK